MALGVIAGVEKRLPPGYVDLNLKAPALQSGLDQAVQGRPGRVRLEQPS